MLYMYPFLDIVLGGICLVMVTKGSNFTFEKIDFIIFILMILFLFAFLRNTNGLSQFIKIESGFLLYILGRMYYLKANRYIKFMQIGFAFVLMVCIITYITGTGFVYWGAYRTFRGLHYFKTDLAAAMAQCLSLFVLQYPLKKRDIAVCLLCVFFIIISNARMYYFISVIIVVMGLCYYLENKNRKIIIKINTGLLISLIAIIVTLMLLMNYLDRLYGEQFLLLDISSADDLFNGANTQGRNTIWEDVYGKFTRQDFLTRLYGIDLCSDISMNHDSHNTFIKVLYSIGYIGSIVFLYFLYQIITAIKVLQNRKLFCLTLAFVSIYLLGGLSATTIQSTLISWLPMFFLGTIVSWGQVEKKIVTSIH